MDKNPETIRVVSAIADRKKTVLYLEDGNQIILNQGDHRLGNLLDIIIPITTKGEVAVVNLKDFSIYAAFEAKSSGLTKFFKVAKSKVSGWFGKSEEPEVQQATVTDEGQKLIIEAVVGKPMTAEDIDEHGIEITDDEIDEENEVVVAVVENKETGKKAVIPGVQAIRPLIDHAVRNNSPGAVEAFLTRCAAFIDKRQHSVDDLMRFLEKGDLPLSEDGAIIAYKMLRSTQDKGVFVDCHTRSIRQRVGSYVCVNEDLVDLNRRNECSNGLHIARRSYLGGFGGDVCVLCKIDPEDVMVVPHNDANKVRVKGYHIISQLSKEAMGVLRANRPMTGDEASLKAVYDAIKGNHVSRIERVQVNGQRGTDVVVTPMDHRKERGFKEDYSHTEKDLKTAAALDDEKNAPVPIQPRDINKRLNEAHSENAARRDDMELTEEMLAMSEEDKEAVSDFHDAVVANGGTNEGMGDPKPEPKKETPKEATGPVARMATAILDYQTSPDAQKAAAAQAAVQLKRSLKKGWGTLGVNSQMVDELIAAAGNAATPKVAPAEPVKFVEVEIPKTAKAAPKAPAKVKGPAPDKHDANVGKKRSKAEEARELYKRWTMSGSPKDLTALLTFKKQAKKGWSVLGFSETEINKITK